MFTQRISDLFRQTAAALAISTLVVAANATPVNYLVKIDTSTLAGSAWLDLQFNPAQANSPLTHVELSQFTGVLVTSNSPVVSGDVSGSLPGVVNFGNGTAYNDLFQSVFLGGVFSFRLNFDAPGLSPDGYGSAFSVSLYGADQITPLGNFDPATGSLVTFDVSNAVTVTTFDQTVVSTQVVPEPSSLALVLLGFGALAHGRSRRQVPCTAV
jgi:hypothetical protein